VFKAPNQRDKLTGPISAIGGAEEKILNDNGDEEPYNNLSTEKGLVERRHLSWGLAIVVRKSKVHDQPNSPEEESDRKRDGTCRR
jgi:hypothetical protein